MYSVKVINEETSRFIVKSTDYEFTIDTKGHGMTPPDTLLASLGSCVGVYIRKYADGAKLDLKKFELTVEAEFDKTPPVCFRRIKIDIDIRHSDLDERRKKALLEFVKNCPVHNTLKSRPAVEIGMV